MAIPIGYEEVTVTSAAAIGLTASKIDTLAAANPDVWALIYNSNLTTYPVAWVMYGTPVAGTFQQMAAGDSIQIKGVQMLKAFLAIGIGGSAKLAVNYFSGE